MVVLTSLDGLPEVARDLGRAHNGRVRLASQILDQVRRHPRVSRVCALVVALATSALALEGVTRATYLEDFADLIGQRVVWLEPARHFTWSGASFRAITGGDFGVVGVAHGLSYAEQTLPNLASVALWSPRDRVIVPSHAAARALRTQYSRAAEALGRPANGVRDGITVIPYAIDDLAVNRATSLAGGHMKILVLARLSMFDKLDWDALLTALVSLKRAKCEFACTIAGYVEDPEFPALLSTKLRQLSLHADVVVRPNVSDAERENLLAEADVYVNLSVTNAESFGLGIEEAQAARCAVVCSDWGPFRELVAHGIDGVLVPTSTNETNPFGDELYRMLGIRGPGRNKTLPASVDRRALGRVLIGLSQRPDHVKAMQEAGQQRYLATRPQRSLVDQIVELLWSASGRLPAVESWRTSVGSPFSHYCSVRE